MPVDTDSISKGAMRAAPAVAGGMVAGPVLGPAVAGIATDAMTGRSVYAPMGIGISLAGLFLTSGGSSNKTNPRSVNQRGMK